jgi:hypothetical protein
MIEFGRKLTNEDRRLIKGTVERLERLAADLQDVLGRGGLPSPDELPDAPSLDHWAPMAEDAVCLVGRSTGHPGLPGKGRLIRTSGLWLISQEMGVARTLSRWYRLGRPADFGMPGGTARLDH